MSSSRTVNFMLAPAHSTISLFNIFSAAGFESIRLHRTWALDVADNASGCVVHELNSDLSHTTTGTYSIIPSVPCPFCHSMCEFERTSTAQNPGDLDQLDGNL